MNEGVLEQALKALENLHNGVGNPLAQYWILKHTLNNLRSIEAHKTAALLRKKEIED